MLLQFRDAPGEADFRELGRRGAAVIQYVPDHGLLVSAGDDFSTAGLALRWAGRPRSLDKISPLIEEMNAAERAAAVVEFFPDVPAGDAKSLVREHDLELRERDGLLPWQLMVEGQRGELERLADWDEVAYVFPASADLLEGAAVTACAGAITAYGPMGQYVAAVGEGWDGPGANSVELRYVFSQVTDTIAPETLRLEVVRALQEWARYAALRFTPGNDAWGTRTLNILFGRGHHGDPFPFDGRGRILAHTFYPAPPNPEPLAGDLHFDGDENWAIGEGTDLFSVALHEAGHALGLGHSDRPGAVMYPYYRPASGLATEDIAAIRRLYAAAPEPGSPEPPLAPTPTAPPKPPTAAPETPTAPPQPPPSPKAPQTDTTAPSMAILAPASTTVSTYSATIVLRGTASDAGGIAEVSWSHSSGAAGLAQGTTAWVTGQIPLREGNNVITVRARDTAGNTAWRSVTVARRRR